MRDILSNALAEPERRRSRWLWLLHDVLSILMCIVGILGVVGVFWLALVAGGVE